MLLLILEAKPLSPFGHVSPHTWDHLFRIAESEGDIISVHTDPCWGGSFELIKRARSLTTKPILAKGIHKTDEDIEKAIAAGADWVLVVGRIPKIHPDRCLIEPLTLEELKSIPQNLRVVWNSRDLSNGKQKTETFKQAREIFKGWLCQASNIKTIADIEQGADAVLVGENLITFVESIK